MCYTNKLPFACLFTALKCAINLYTVVFVCVCEQGYKRAGEGMYGPPAKRHDGGEGYMQYGGQQPDMYGQYGPGYMGPERRPMQGQYPPFPYGRQGPPQHAMMSGPSPASASGPPTAGPPQGNMWHPRTDMGYPYQGRQGQGPPYTGMGRGGEEADGRGPGQEGGAWPGHPSQRQSPYPQPPSSSSVSSAGPVPPMTNRQPPSSFQSPANMPNHISRAPSPAPFPRPMPGSMSPSKAHFMASMQKMQKPGMPPAMLGSQSGGPMPSQGLPPIHREINFPPGSVEATQPVLKPRRRITAKDIGRYLS